MACQAAGKPWQAYACLKCRRAAPAALPFLPVMVLGIFLLCRFCLKNQACSDRSGRAAPVAPETALPAHLTVCKATAPDGAVNPSAATPAACFPLWTFRGLE